MATILGANSVTGYEVANSIRFNAGDSAYLHKSQGSGNQRTFTISFWVKRSRLNDRQAIFSATADGSNECFIWFDTNDELFVKENTSNITNFEIRTNRKFRDVSAWYHIVVAYDTTNGTAGNRVRIYVNGSEETSFANETQPDQNFQTKFNNGSTTLNIGRMNYNAEYFGGYLAEACLIDGSALTPTSFGEFDEDSPTIWKPIDVSGLTFGTNGFYLDFEDSSNLGNDANGGTDLTEVNLAATDQSIDTCTNNFCTLNPLTARGSSGTVISEGSLQYAAVAGAGDSSVFGTMGITPGMKVYFEVKLVQNTAQNSIGIHNLYDGGDGEFVKGGSEAGTYSFKPRGASSVTQYFNNGSSNNHSVNNAANDTILGVAIDNANGQIHYSLDGTFINSSDPTDNDPVALVTGFGGSTEQYIHASLDTSGGTEPINQFNFGSPPYAESGGESDANGHGNFNQAVPSGYFALNSKNLSEHG